MPLHLSVWPGKLKLDEEKSKHANLARQTVLAHIFAQFADGCKRQAWQALTPAREECNKYIWLVICFWLPDDSYIAAKHVSDWPIIMTRPGALLLVVCFLFAVPVSFMGGVGKKLNN
jgi:hypothetical protein